MTIVAALYQKLKIKEKQELMKIGIIVDINICMHVKFHQIIIIIIINVHYTSKQVGS